MEFVVMVASPRRSCNSVWWSGFLLGLLTRSRIGYSTILIEKRPSSKILLLVIAIESPIFDSDYFFFFLTSEKFKCFIPDKYQWSSTPYIHNHNFHRLLDPHDRCVCSRNHDKAVARSTVHVSIYPQRPPFPLPLHECSASGNKFVRND